MRAHLVQMDIAWEDRPESRRRAAALLGSVHVEPGDLILLPEMFDSGFSFNLERTSDHDGASRAFLADMARSSRALVMGGVTVQDPDGRARNRVVVYGPDSVALAQYDKNFLFPLGEPSEAACLTRGEGVATFRWPGASGGRGLLVAPLICYDLRFPELFGDALAAGAQVMALIANWPASRAHHWRSLAIARAIECQALVLAVNRSGRDPRLDYSGGSIVVSAKGEVLAEADDKPQVLSVEIAVDEIEAWRGAFPAWRDRLARRPGAVPRAR